jgi:hypothetical protein
VIVGFVDICGIVEFHQYQHNKESLNSNGQQFHQYQHNKESLNSDGQQFHQYQHNKESLNIYMDVILDEQLGHFLDFMLKN